MKRLLTLHDYRETSGYYASGLWQSDTLYSLLARWADERGGRSAISDPWRCLTWRELKAEVDTVAAALHAVGLQAGDRVSVWMGNRVEAVAVFLACSRNGYVYNTSIHHTYTVDQAATLMENVAARALFAQPGHGADGKQTDIFARAAQLPSMKAVFAVPLPDQALPPHALAFPSSATHTPPPCSDDPDKIVYLAFTSGTSGAPKGVMHSDNSLLANARAMVADWGHDQDTVLLTLSHMSHHIGTVALDQALVGGFHLVLSDAAAGLDTIDYIVARRASYIMGVPTHAIDLLARMKQRGMDHLGEVRTFYLAGAPIPLELAERLVQMQITPQNVYGMTENGSHQYTRPADDLATITRTCGKACAAYEIALFDEADQDREVAQGEIGQIGGRGAMRMLGYFDNQAATETSFNAGGWFLSGDLGRFDETGNLHVVGRIKDVIIRGGHNIYPAQVEDLAMRHPLVQKAAAVPISDERLGERVCLVVMGDGENHPDGRDLIDHLLSAGLSRFDLPEFLLIDPDLPLGPTGKVLKREIVRQICDGERSPQPIARKEAVA